MQAAAPPLPVRALLLAERLDARGLERAAPPLSGPVALADAGPGHAFLFRWGALVTLGLSPEAAEQLRARLRPRLVGPLADPVEEIALLRIGLAAGETEGPDAAGIVVLRDDSLPRLALVAEALAKSAVLSHHEAGLARSLDLLEPVVARLRDRGRLAVRSTALLRLIGEAIAARARAAARVDTAAKPDLLWDHPHLAALHDVLAAEWELTERSAALEHKLGMIRETSEVLLGLIEARRSRGLELAVVLLIAMELGTTLYGLLGF